MSGASLRGSVHVLRAVHVCNHIVTIFLYGLNMWRFACQTRPLHQERVACVLSVRRPDALQTPLRLDPNTGHVPPKGTRIHH
eukprot:5259357-Prymnesium_polylepis.1